MGGGGVSVPPSLETIPEVGCPKNCSSSCSLCSPSLTDIVGGDGGGGEDGGWGERHDGGWECRCRRVLLEQFPRWGPRKIVVISTLHIDCH